MLKGIEVKVLPDWEDFPGFYATILKVSRNQKEIILKVKAPFKPDGIYYEYLVAGNRHEGFYYSELLNEDYVPSNFTRVPPEQIQSQDPFDTSWWRGGGGAFIGAVVRKKDMHKFGF